MINVINPEGDLIGKVQFPDYPEIEGIQFSRINTDILHIAQNYNQSICFRVQVSKDLTEKSTKEKRLTENYEN